MAPLVGVVEPSETPSLKERRGRGRWLVGLGAVIALAAIAALGLALLSTRDDLDNERAKLAQIDVATPASEPAPETGALGPVTPAGQRELIALQKQLDELNGVVLQAKEDLATEQSAHATDAATQAQKLADLQAQLTELQTQLAQLQALFPLTAASVAAADPTGQYSVALTAGNCTLADCAPLSALSIAFSDATTVSGDRAAGTTVFDAGKYTISGTLAPAIAPTCAGQPADATYELELHVTSVDVADTKLRAAQMAGTYTETIGGATATSAACAGQSRSYSVDLVRQ